MMTVKINVTEALEVLPGLNAAGRALRSRWGAGRRKGQKDGKDNDIGKCLPAGT